MYKTTWKEIRKTRVQRKFAFTKPCRIPNCSKTNCMFLHSNPIQQREALTDQGLGSSKSGSEEKEKSGAGVIKQLDEASEMVKKLRFELSEKSREVESLEHSNYVLKYCNNLNKQVIKSQDAWITKMEEAKRVASESGSEFSPDDSDNEDAPSDSGSDYEPGDPVKIGRGKTAKSTGKQDSGKEFGGVKKKGGAQGRKKRAGDCSDKGDSDYEKPKDKKKKVTPVKLSENLADIVGSDKMPRTEVVKRMWAYIKENKLQDPTNRQYINCDEKLSKVSFHRRRQKANRTFINPFILIQVIPTKRFRGFGMVKYLKDHMNVE